MLEQARVTIPLTLSHTAQAICVSPRSSSADALAALELPPYAGVIVVHGGATKMEEGLLDDVQDFADQCLAPFAQTHRMVIVDGGTDTGVSQTLGNARQRIAGTYPLIGILPHRYALYPGGPPPDGVRIALNPAHTHFILVEGESFGAESALMVGLLAASGKPGVALVLNGGDIVLREVQAHAARGSELVTVRGSGRIADELAKPGSAARASLPAGTRLHVLNIRQPVRAMAQLAALLSPDRAARA